MGFGHHAPKKEAKENKSKSKSKKQQPKAKAKAKIKRRRKATMLSGLPIDSWPP